LKQFLVVLFGAGFAMGQGRGPAQGPCDRACLEGFINQYLEAMVAHDAKRLPVTPDVRFTENDIELKLGEGLWKTASGLGTYKLYLADPAQGQVAFYGTIRENTRPTSIALRLKVDNRRISEAESIVIRGAGTANNMEKAGSPDPILMETVPPAERLPRTELVAKSNLYFEAIEQGNGQVAPFDPNCERFENGTKTTPKEGCSAQLDTKIFDYIQKIAPRRFLVVDEERQVVFGFFMFNHPGDITWVNSPGQGRHEMPASAKRPFNVDVAEAFRIKNGMIRKVEALMTSLPYGVSSPFVPQREP
jgi:hypothetical protein